MLILVPALGRLAQVWAASLMNYAREGEGMASSLVRRAKWHHALLPTLQVGLLILLLFVLHHPYAIPVLAAFGGIVLSTTILCLISRKRLGESPAMCWEASRYSVKPPPSSESCSLLHR